MTSIIEFVPKSFPSHKLPAAPPPAPAHRVAILAYDDLCLFEFGLACEIFGPRPGIGEGWYETAVAAVSPGPLRASLGLTVGTNGGLELLAGAGTIVVPGWTLAEEPPPRQLVEALTAADARGARIVTICSGSFLAAACGLLDGRRATTHWLYADLLQERYPRAQVVRDVLYVDEGSVLTSAGSAAGIDLCLHIVRTDHGAARANLVARRMVVAAHRDGDQRQFVERPVPREHEAGRLSALLDRLRAEPERPTGIAALAREAGMSRRTFVRRFEEATALSPGRWLVRERVARARDLLETSDAPVEEVARLAGFGAPAALRHHFAAQLGVSPTAYRQRFGAAPEHHGCARSP